jgi:hypothetical protein
LCFNNGVPRRQYDAMYLTVKGYTLTLPNLSEHFYLSSWITGNKPPYYTILNTHRWA